MLLDAPNSTRASASNATTSSRGSALFLLFGLGFRTGGQFSPSIAAGSHSHPLPRSVRDTIRRRQIAASRSQLQFIENITAAHRFDSYEIYLSTTSTTPTLDKLLVSVLSSGSGRLMNVGIHQVVAENRIQDMPELKKSQVATSVTPSLI